MSFDKWPKSWWIRADMDAIALGWACGQIVRGDWWYIPLMVACVALIHVAFPLEQPKRIYWASHPARESRWPPLY